MKANLAIAITVVMGLGKMDAQTLASANQMSDNEQYQSAALVFEQLISKEPNNGDYYYYAAENLFSDNQKDKAKTLYEKGAELSPTNPFNFIGLGKLAYYAGNTESANSSFFKAKALAKGKNATVLMEIAEVYLEAPLKDAEAASKLLREAQALEPKNPRVYLLMGDAAMVNNSDGSLAISNYEKALDLDKKYTKALLREGKLYSQARNYNLALDYYNKAVDIDSSFAPAYRERAELLFRANRNEQATADYGHYLKLNDNISARVRYAEFKFTIKDYKGAIEEIGTIQKKDSSNLNLYRIKGYSACEMGNYSVAVYNLSKFIKQWTNATCKPLRADDYAYYGKSLIKSGKDSIGRINLVSALQLDSSRTDIMGDLAASYLKSSKFSEAIATYKRKIAAGKDKAPGANDLLGLGRSYYYAKEYSNADSLFAQVNKVSPTFAYAYLMRANCAIDSKLDFNEKGEVKGIALPHFEKYIELNAAPADLEKNKKDVITAYEYVGYYYLLNKDKEKSKAAWTKLKEIDPNNEKAKKALVGL